MDFFSALSLDRPKAHLVATGELDAFAAVQLRSRLDEAVGDGHLYFDVDASAVTFVDAGGLGTLLRLRNAVAPLGGSVTFVAASERLRQLSEITGLTTTLGLDQLSTTRPPGPSPVSIGQPRRSSSATRRPSVA